MARAARSFSKWNHYKFSSSEEWEDAREMAFPKRASHLQTLSRGLRRPLFAMLNAKRQIQKEPVVAAEIPKMRRIKHIHPQSMRAHIR